MSKDRAGEDRASEDRASEDRASEDRAREDRASEVPVLRVVKGDPSAEELAALITVLVSSGPAAEPSEPQVSAWARYWRTHRRPLQAGPGAWRRALD